MKLHRSFFKAVRRAKIKLDLLYIELAIISVALFDAKNRLSELIDAVQAGSEVAITRRGQPVARLVAAFEPQRADPQIGITAAFAQLSQIRGKFALEEDFKTIAREGLA